MMIVDICEEIEKNDKSNKQKIFLLTKDNDDRFGGSDISFSEIAEFFFGFSTEREYTKDRILWALIQKLKQKNVVVFFSA